MLQMLYPLVVLASERSKTCYLPSSTPIVDYITAIKYICGLLGKDNLFGKTDCTGNHVRVKDVLSKSKLIHPNTTKEERKALQDLRKDDSCMVLRAYKGVALVFIKKSMYFEKCMAFLNDEEVNQEFTDQTMSIHSKVVKNPLDLKKY